MTSSTQKKPHVSLLWRILFSTSVAITLLFVAVGWVLQDQFARIASMTLEDEARASFQAYESLWKARADQLASVSQVLSRMPDVRAAFSTGDKATIHDTAQEVWDQLSLPGTLFLVCDPRGSVITSVMPGEPTSKLSPPQPAVPGLVDAPFVRLAARDFPKQARGFVVLSGELYQIVITPIYVAAGRDSALLNVLVAGTEVDAGLAHQLKIATGGSDFVFLTGGKVTASTLDPKAEASLHNATAAQERVTIGDSEYYQFAQTLTDIEGHPLGELRILRSFEDALERIAGMRTRLAVLWFGGVLLGLGLTYLLARRLLKPVEALDLAAAEIAKGNYNVRVGIESRDEIGRLAQTFNSMCASISAARQDLIRQERISTIGRLSTSIIHDLRNPLAAIYGGAEMLVDSQLSPPQVQRLSQNIYRSSRQIQDMLQELADVTQGRAHAREVCRLREIVQAACEPLTEAAETNRVDVKIDVADEVEVQVDRSRMERVFQNLIGNAIEAMPYGGFVRVQANRKDGEVLVSVEDNGPGIPREISDKLFQPFVTSGKNNGMGLGLALSRTTVLSHGGDLWAERMAPGVRFLMRLPA